MGSGVGLKVGVDSGVAEGEAVGSACPPELCDGWKLVEEVLSGVGVGSAIGATERAGVDIGATKFIGEKNVFASLIAKAIQLNCMSIGAGLFNLTVNPLALLLLTIYLISLSNNNCSSASLVEAVFREMVAFTIG